MVSTFETSTTFENTTTIIFIFVNGPRFTSLFSLYAFFLLNLGYQFSIYISLSFLL